MTEVSKWPICFFNDSFFFLPEVEYVLNQLPVSQNVPSSWGFLITLWTSKVLLKTRCDFYSFQYSVTYPFEVQHVAKVMSFFFKYILPWNFRIIVVFSYFSFATTMGLGRSVRNWNKLGQRPRWKYFSWKSVLKNEGSVATNLKREPFVSLVWYLIL